MPRFFDDYSNTYLTHDSAAGRKQQRRGWKFRENFKLHYNAHLEEWRAGPLGLASAQQAYLRTRRSASGQISPNDPTVPPLPDGWIELLDEATGVHYYINDELNERSWVRPNFRPPGPGGGPPPPNTMGMMNNMGGSMNNNFRPPSLMQQPPPPFAGGPPPPGHQFAQPPPPNSFAPPPPIPPPMGGMMFGAPPPHTGMPPPAMNFPPPPPSAFPKPPS